MLLLYRTENQTGLLTNYLCNKRAETESKTKMKNKEARENSRQRDFFLEENNLSDSNQSSSYRPSEEVQVLMQILA